MRLVLLAGLIGLCFVKASLAGEVKLVGVSDGDTLIFNRGDGLEYVTIYGIDAPEIGQAWGKKSKRYLEDLLAAGKYRVKMNEFEKMMGASCRVYFVNPKNNIETDLACHMLINGYAYVDSRIDKNKENNRKYRNSEQMAKDEREGVWSQAKVDYPWNYRKRHNLFDEETVAANEKAKSLSKTVPRRG